MKPVDDMNGIFPFMRVCVAGETPLTANCRRPALYKKGDGSEFGLSPSDFMATRCAQRHTSSALLPRAVAWLPLLFVSYFVSMIPVCAVGRFGQPLKSVEKITAQGG
jgi:hypothetical protein